MLLLYKLDSIARVATLCSNWCLQKYLERWWRAALNETGRSVSVNGNEETHIRELNSILFTCNSIIHCSSTINVSSLEKKNNVYQQHSNYFHQLYNSGMPHRCNSCVILQLTNYHLVSHQRARAQTHARTHKHKHTHTLLQPRTQRLNTFLQKLKREPVKKSSALCCLLVVHQLFFTLTSRLTLSSSLQKQITRRNNNTSDRPFCFTPTPNPPIWKLVVSGDRKVLNYCIC